MSINFYVCILQRIAVLIMNNVLVACHSSKSGDVAQTVWKSKLSALIGCEQKVVQTPSALSRSTLCEYRECKSSSLVYFRPKFGKLGVSPNQRTSSQLF